MNNIALILGVGLAALVLMIGLLLLGDILRLWVMTTASGAGIPFSRLLAMKLRRVNTEVVALAHILAVRDGIEIPLDSIETHALAGGKPPAVVKGLIAAKEHGVSLEWDEACALDLSGFDVKRTALRAHEQNRPHILPEEDAVLIEST